MSENAPTTVVTQVASRPGLTLPVLASALSMAVIGLGGVSWLLRVEFRTSQIEISRAERVAKSDARFAAIETRLDTMSDTPFRLKEVETKVVAVNDRVDRISERLFNSIDALGRQLADLDKRVTVIDSKLDALAERARPASVKVPGR